MTLMKRDAGERVIRAFRLDEISAVDRPAQEGAKMAIMKRRNDDDELEADVDGEDDFGSDAHRRAQRIGNYRAWIAWFAERGYAADDARSAAREMEPDGARYSDELYGEDDEEDDDMNDAEDQLTKMAKEHAAKHNVTFEKAYSTVIETPEGSALYSKSLEERKRVVKVAARVEVKKTGGEILLDDLAKKRAAAGGITLEKAYLEICDTDEGKAAYNMHLAEVAAAA